MSTFTHIPYGTPAGEAHFAFENLKTIAQSIRRNYVMRGATIASGIRSGKFPGADGLVKYADCMLSTLPDRARIVCEVYGLDDNLRYLHDGAWGWNVNGLCGTVSDNEALRGLIDEIGLVDAEGLDERWSEMLKGAGLRLDDSSRFSANADGIINSDAKKPVKAIDSFIKWCDSQLVAIEQLYVLIDVAA